MEAIFDFNEYEYMIIESDDGKVIAEIRQDQIDVEDGYRVRMIRRKSLPCDFKSESDLL